MPATNTRRSFKRDRSGSPVPPPKTLCLLSVQAVAEYAGVSGTTVRRWIKSGELSTYRAGKQIRVDEADLVKFLRKDQGLLLL